jgi:hypothetical protein
MGWAAPTLPRGPVARAGHVPEPLPLAPQALVVGPERGQQLRRHDVADHPDADVPAAMAALLAALQAAGARTVVYIARLLEGQQLARRPGSMLYPVIPSAEMPPKTLIGIDPTMFVAAIGNIEVGETEDVTIHEDTQTLPLTSAAGVQAQPERSSWQTATTFARAVFDVNWTVAQDQVFWTTIS